MVRHSACFSPSRRIVAAEPARQNAARKCSPCSSCCESLFVCDVETTKVRSGDQRNLHDGCLGESRIRSPRPRCGNERRTFKETAANDTWSVVRRNTGRWPKRFVLEDLLARASQRRGRPV